MCVHTTVKHEANPHSSEGYPAFVFLQHAMYTVEPTPLILVAPMVAGCVWMAGQETPVIHVCLTQTAVSCLFAFGSR